MRRGDYHRSGGEIQRRNAAETLAKVHRGMALNMSDTQTPH